MTGVFSRSGLMPVLVPVPHIWRRALVCTVALGCIVLAVTELVRKPPVMAPLVKTVERHVQDDTPLEPPAPGHERGMLTFEERWAPVQNQWGESRKLFMVTPVTAPANARESPVGAEDRRPQAPDTVLVPGPERGKDTKDRRQLAQQEVCAVHGMRKVWTSKWRWRCQR